MKPIRVSLVLNESQCSINCVFCNGTPMGDIEGNIRFELDKLEKIAAKNEIESVEVSGNDPAEYEGLPEFIHKIKEIVNTEFITVSTYGGFLKDKKYLKALIDSGMTGVRIPIYGATEDVHDAVTDTKGSFDDLLICFNNLEKSKIKLDLTTLILKENQQQLRELFYVFSRIKFKTSLRIGLPAYVTTQARFDNSVPDFNKLREDLPKALKYALSKGLKIDVADTPYCLVGFDYPYMAKSPRGHGAYDYRKDEEGMEMIKDEVVPKYLKKTKSEVCKSCIYDNGCEGIYKEYVDKGVFEFTPIT